MPKLHIASPNVPVRTLDVATLKMPAVIGRDSELSQVVLADSQVSRAHFVINTEGGVFSVEDLGSRNGTLVNEKKIAKCPLKSGDKIRIGGTTITVDTADATANDPLAGKRLGGFDLHSVLGRGRFGTVYRGIQVALSRSVAIKVLAEEYRGDPQRVQAFLTEARRAGRLNHPNLVQVHDVCQVDEHYLLIMELMKCSASDQLKAQGPLPEPAVLRLLDDMAKALNYAESQRLVHRDVKPDNILVNDEGVYKLADLGIATAITADGVAHQDRIFGSPHYVAPEQARGGSIDGRADLYALGATAWHLITGKPIFDGTSRQIVAAHINAEIPDLEELAPDVSESLVELVYDLLEKDPNDRPVNAIEVSKRVDDVTRLAEKENTGSRPRVRRRVVRRRRRR
ncbi:MAG: protein kinase [Planctomycetes bacterium]|nr:protein kinase [Planctomycetota bacterium]